jgi:hypothetical protein
MEILLYQRITKHCLLVLEDLSTATTFFAVLSIAAFAIMVGISNNGMALSSSSSLLTVNKDIHKVHLSINIIDPARDSTIPSNLILVNGTTFDHANGVQKVEVFAHAYPFRDTFNFKPAKPISEGNWSKWSIPILVNTTGVYRILAHVTDNQGNQNWTKVKIFVPIVSNSTGQAAVQGSPSQIKKIAIVLSSFTEAAYSTHAFYTFYNKYGSIPIQQDVKTDLDMLNPPIRYGSCLNINPHENVEIANLSLHCPANPDDRFIIILAYTKNYSSCFSHHYKR